MHVTPVADGGNYCIVTKDEKADKGKNEMTSDGVDIPYVDDETSEEGGRRQWLATYAIFRGLLQTITPRCSPRRPTRSPRTWKGGIEGIPEQIRSFDYEFRLFDEFRLFEFRSFDEFWGVERLRPISWTLLAENAEPTLRTKLRSQRILTARRGVREPL